MIKLIGLLVFLCVTGCAGVSGNADADARAKAKAAEIDRLNQRIAVLIDNPNSEEAVKWRDESTKTAIKKEQIFQQLVNARETKSKPSGDGEIKRYVNKYNKVLVCRHDGTEMCGEYSFDSKATLQEWTESCISKGGRQVESCTATDNNCYQDIGNRDLIAHYYGSELDRFEASCVGNSAGVLFDRNGRQYAQNPDNPYRAADKIDFAPEMGRILNNRLKLELIEKGSNKNSVDASVDAIHGMISGDEKTVKDSIKQGVLNEMLKW